MLEKLHFKSSLFKGILDDGESIVMMKSSILKDLMGIVQDITVDSFEVNNTYDDEVMQGSQYNPVEEVLVEDDLSISTSKKGKGSPKNKTNEDVSQFEKDFLRDDEAIEPAALYEPKANDPNLLISDGLNFLGRLAETLSDASKTESLIKSITKTDEKGQTFLHIPIDNRVIENGLKLLMGLLMGNK